MRLWQLPFIRAAVNLAERERRRIIAELVQVRGLMPLLMKPRNGQKWTTEDRRELSGWGPERIGQDLSRRGVPAELVEAALAARDRDDELAAARDVLSERFGALADDRARNRAWQLLVRRGFDAELAYDAVRAHAHA